VQAIDTLVQARWVIPIEPDGVVYEDYAVAIHAGRIVDLLPIVEAGKRYRAQSTFDGREHALIPGLINAHTHAAMSLLRGLADDLKLMDWLERHIWPAERRWVDTGFVQDGTRLAVAEMIRGGTTCFNDMYFYPGEAARVAAAAGIRACVGLIVLDFPHAYAHNADQYLDRGLALHDELRHHPLVRTAFAPHAPYSVSDAPLIKVRTLAEELDIPIHMHVHETAEEVEQSVKQKGVRPLERLCDLGLLSPRLQAVHMTQLEDTELELVAEAGAHVLHCPESNLKLAAGLCPTYKLTSAGVNIALGTDGAASNNDLDMFGEMHTATLLAKAVAGDASALPARTALRMATLNGAKALAWDDEIGSLEVGKAADLVAVYLGEVETQPLYHPISQLVYATGRDKVTDVWIAGRQVLKERRLMTLDEAALVARARQWRQVIAAGNGTRS
jgi:5-methylthioadenosine/S-adenosylhomocysteine deaminase